VTCFRTEFHKPISSDSLLVGIRPKAKEKCFSVAILLPCVLQKMVTLRQLHVFRIFIAISFQNLKLIAARLCSTIQVRPSAMLFLMTAGNYEAKFWVASNGRIFISSFVKICQLVQKLKNNTHSSRQAVAAFSQIISYSQLIIFLYHSTKHNL
jgi:hypothetical protein